MISVHITPHDIIEMRFVYSPLFEAVMSYEVLITPAKQVFYQAWVDEVRRTLRGMQFPYMNATILSHHYTADFLTPPPLITQRSFEEELLRLREVSEDVIRLNILKVIEKDGMSSERQHFLTYPREALECLIDELRFYWNHTLSHHWSRITSALENDILYRARQLALSGADALLTNLSPIIAYGESTIQILKDSHQDEHHLTGQGLLLAPVIFLPKVSWQITPEWHPLILYGARGTGVWHQDNIPEIDENLQLILGEGKAKILQSLVNPLNTGELAHKLNVTPGAISQHLNKLTQAGLVESHRSGNFVFYRLSNRGERLLNVFNE